MNSLAGDFRTDLPLPDALVACTEALDDLGWRVESVEERLIVSYPDSGSADSPKIEVELSDSDGTAGVRIIGTDTEADPLTTDELIPHLDRARDAIQASVEKTEPSE